MRTSRRYKKEFQWELVGAILAGLLMLWLKVYILGSLATSSVKAVSDSCDKSYGIELSYVINGNWFCN